MRRPGPRRVSRPTSGPLASYAYVLEDQLDSELNLPRTAQIAARGPGRKNLSESVCRLAVLRLPEIRVVEDIERFGPELNGNALADGRVLGEGHVDVLEAGPGEDVPAGVAE